MRSPTLLETLLTSLSRRAGDGDPLLTLPRPPLRKETARRTGTRSSTSTRACPSSRGGRFCASAASIRLRGGRRATQVGLPSPLATC